MTINQSVKSDLNSVLIKKIVNTAARLEKKIKGEIEINFVSPAVIKNLNSRFRNRNQVTDVLAFAWGEDSRVASSILGQIYLCVSQIRRQAKEFTVSAKEESARMLVHGLLHIVGYDHQNDSEAKRMFALQEKILSLGLK